MGFISRLDWSYIWVRIRKGTVREANCMWESSVDTGISDDLNSLALFFFGGCFLFSGGCFLFFSGYFLFSGGYSLFSSGCFFFSGGCCVSG